MFSFDNRFLKTLPKDPEERNFVRQVHNSCYSMVMPTHVKQPKTVAVSRPLLTAMNWPESFSETQQFSEVFAGNELLDGMEPYAMCYGGHQFGNWAGQLGDGRAINLGEVTVNSGVQALQLKGAGMTPYSRHADGLAVLRSSIREYLCSEAMHHLGVPTTRALSLVLTGEKVARDMFYDGNSKHETGAIVCRVAPSFLRFGSFEILTSRNDVETLKTLADFCIREYFPELDMKSPQVYLDWFKEVCKRTLKMIIHWQRVGFVHGVMNTDNMSILGLTIDYGPYGWIDNFDLNWTPNTTDLPGRRYAFGKQAQVAHWNLYKFAEAMYPLIGEAKGLEAVLNEYPEYYQQQELAMQQAKLGLSQQSSKQQQKDVKLIKELTAILELTEIDMTLFYRNLADLDQTQSVEDNIGHFVIYSYLPKLLESSLIRVKSWLAEYQHRLAQEKDDSATRKIAMNQVNPWFVLRNYLCQQAIEKADASDFSMLYDLEKVALNPYAENDEFKQFVEKRPDWAKTKAGCSMLSCSS